MDASRPSLTAMAKGRVCWPSTPPRPPRPSMTFSWDEFVISFLLTRFDTTLPVEIWNLLRSGLNPRTNAIGSLVIGVSVVLAILFELILLRRNRA